MVFASQQSIAGMITMGVLAPTYWTLVPVHAVNYPLFYPRIYGQLVSKQSVAYSESHNMNDAEEKLEIWPRPAH
jgi:hypothetical protein